MGLEKLVKRLRREAGAHPKKAAALGILVVVAIYCWAPLLKGWVSSSASGGLAAGAVAASAPVALDAPRLALTNTQDGNTPEKAVAYSWEEVVKWMEQDPRSRPPRDLGGRRDPFRAVKAVVAERETKRSEEPPKPILTPSNLGMTLSSTLVGPGERLAVINGKVYREGQTIEVAKDGRKATFKLVEVHGRRVVLRHQNEQVELALPERKRSGRMELLGRNK